MTDGPPFSPHSSRMCLQPPQLGKVGVQDCKCLAYSQCQYYSIWHGGTRPSHGISATLRVRRAAALLLLLLLTELCEVTIECTAEIIFTRKPS